MVEVHVLQRHASVQKIIKKGNAFGKRTHSPFAFWSGMLCLSTAFKLLSHGFVLFSGVFAPFHDRSFFPILLHASSGRS